MIVLRTVACGHKSVFFFDGSSNHELDHIAYYLITFPCRFIADTQMNQACMLFVEQHGTTIVNKNLCRNILLHLVSMHDFGLVNTMTIDKAMTHLRDLKQEDGQEMSQDNDTIGPADDGGPSGDGEVSVSNPVKNHSL